MEIAIFYRGVVARTELSQPGWLTVYIDELRNGMIFSLLPTNHPAYAHALLINLCRYVDTSLGE